MSLKYSLWEFELTFELAAKLLSYVTSSFPVCKSADIKIYNKQEIEDGMRWLCKLQLSGESRCHLLDFFKNILQNIHTSFWPKS